MMVNTVLIIGKKIKVAVEKIIIIIGDTHNIWARVNSAFPETVIK